MPEQPLRRPQRPASWPDYAPDPPKKRSWGPWPAVLVIMLTLGVLSGGAAYLGLRWMQDQASSPVDASTAGSGTTQPTRPAVTQPRRVEVGAVARDGGFAWKVTRVGTGSRSTLVYVVLKNVGSGKQTLVSSIQQLRDAGGRTHQVDSAVTAGASRRLWVELSPGKAVRGVMVFPVGTAAKPASVELHGAIGSAGIRVTL